MITCRLLVTLGVTSSVTPVWIRSTVMGPVSDVPAPPLLAFDETGGLLTITSDGELYLARRIDISCGQLQDANESLRQQYFDRLELEVAADGEL